MNQLRKKELWATVFIFMPLYCFCFSVSPVNADPSFPVWFEKKTASANRMGMQSRGRKTEQTPSTEKTDSSQEQKSKMDKKKTRRPMSRPAEYLLKTGVFPSYGIDSPELLKTVCWLKSPDQSYKRLFPEKTDKGILVFDEAFLGGLYQIFLYHNAGVKDDARYYHFSTLWFRNVGDENFEVKPVSKEAREGMYEDQPVFYLKELTKDNEDNFVTQRRYTGDLLPVQVLFRGEAVAGLPVTLVTKQGWQQTVSTDEKGIASFLLIKEVFHNDKVHKEPELYFIRSSYQLEKDGEFEGMAYSKEVYTSSLCLPVYPTPSDWESKSAGFYLIVGSILTILFAAAIRRRRVKII